MTGRRGIRSKQLLGGLTETTGYSKLKEEAPEITICGTRFERGRLWDGDKSILLSHSA
jgi:hypothetical protein